MTKTDIVNIVAQKCGIKKQDSKEFVEATIQAIVDGVVSDGRVSIVGFGTFERKHVEERECKNPQDRSQTITIPAHGALKFKPSAALKEAVK